MARRTKAFGVLLKRLEKDISEVDDLPAHRARRARLQASPVGRWVFGTDDPGSVVGELTVAGHRALVHRPRHGVAPLPVVVNFHGGGWVQGNPEQSRWMASRVAARVGCVVISPSYRLAPEHPYPAAADDAWSILQWVVDHADELGISASRVAVMGDSAGGNLAAVTALRSVAEGGPELRCQVLIYPGTEMYDRFASEDQHADAPVLTSAGMRRFARLYLGDQYGTEDWQASPLRAPSHAGLPKALIVTANLDPLRDNGALYRDALVEAGVPVRYREVDGAFHGFMSLPGPIPAANEGLDDVVGFLRDLL